MTGLNRAGFYRVPWQAMPVEMELRDQMQKVALESPAYGYRRITRKLQQHGWRRRKPNASEYQSAVLLLARIGPILVRTTTPPVPFDSTPCSFAVEIALSTRITGPITL